MARTKGAKDKKPRKKLDYKEKYLKAKETISNMDALVHEFSRDIRELQAQLNKYREQETLRETKSDPYKDNFGLAVTILNSTRHTLKQLARQAAREKNPIMASVFEFLYHDMGNIEKYRRLTEKHEQGNAHVPDPVQPIDFNFQVL